jgi:hypothetical protein
MYHVEVVEHRRGTGWMVARLHELHERHHRASIVCDGAGAGGSLLPDLASVGIEPVTVTTRELTQACGIFADAVMDTGNLRHLSQPELNAAVDGATTKPLADAWKWDRRGSEADITPLVAVTLALWKTAQTKPKARVISLAPLTEDEWPPET